MRISVGLVLESGGMRGLYTAGVLDTFLDVEIRVDGVVSVSVGAPFGVNFLSKQKGRALRYGKKYASNPGYMELRSWLKTGNVVNKEFAYYKVPMELDVFDEEVFEKSGVPFYATVTNLATGEAEYHKVGNVFEQMELLRASSALSSIPKTVEWRGNKYLDGGLPDSIPVGFAKSLGFDKLIVVLTRSIDYCKKPSNGHAYKLFYRKYPKSVEVASRRYQHYNDIIEYISNLGNKGELSAIRPSQNLRIGRLEINSNKYEEIYQIGVKGAEAIMGQLKDYLANDQMNI